MDDRLCPPKNEHFQVEAIMRVLIADDSVARSKAVRALFPKVSAKGPAAGAVVVSCATGKARKDECSCAGVDLGDQPEHAAVGTRQVARGDSARGGRPDAGGNLAMEDRHRRAGRLRDE